MHMKIKQKKLKQMLDVHRHLTNEIKIKFKEAGASITSVDCAHREMVHTLLKKNACEEYNLHTGDLEIGIDIYKLIDFLKLGKSEEIFTVDYDIESNRLVCKLGHLIRTIGLLDIEGMPDPEIPVISMKNKFTVDTSVFNKSLKGVLPSKKESYLGRKTFITVKKDKVILENYDEDEEKNKEKKAIIYNDIDKLTISSGDGEFVVIDSDLFFDQVKEYKKILDDITVEMIDLEQPLRVTGENTEFNLEYWIGPITSDDIRDQHKAVEKSEKEIKPEPEIKEEVKADVEHETFREDLKEDIEKFEEDGDLDLPEQKDDWEPVKEEIEREQIAEDIKKEYCPECGRKLVNNHCTVHLEVEPVDKTAAIVKEFKELEKQQIQEDIKTIQDIEIVKNGDFDMNWENIITLPCVAFVTGRRGAGKSVLSYKLQEELSKKYNLTPVIFGYPNEKKHLLPDNIVLIDDINDLPENSFILIVEAAFKFYARQHNLSEHRLMDHVISLSRQKKQILLFDFHYTRKIDVNIVTDSDVWLAKEPGIFHVKLGARAEIKPLYKKIGDEFSHLTGDKQEYTWVYSNDYEGFMKNTIPSFWSEDLSNVHADIPLYEIERSERQIEEVINKINGRIDTPKITLEKESEVLNEEEITELARYFRYKELVVFADKFSIPKKSKTVILIEMNKIGFLPKIPKRDECGSIVIDEEKRSA